MRRRRYSPRSARPWPHATFVVFSPDGTRLLANFDSAFEFDLFRAHAAPPLARYAAPPPAAADDGSSARAAGAAAALPASVARAAYLGSHRLPTRVCDLVRAAECKMRGNTACVLPPPPLPRATLRRVRARTRRAARAYFPSRNPPYLCVS